MPRRLANIVCLGTARLPQGVASALGVWSQLLAHLCLLPSLCLRPWHVIQLPQSHFPTHLMTFWGWCHCCLEGCRKRVLWGQSSTLGPGAHSITALCSALSSLSRCKVLGLSAHTKKVPCVAGYKCKQWGEMQLYNREILGGAGCPWRALGGGCVGSLSRTVVLALMPVYNSVLGRPSIHWVLFPLCAGDVLAPPQGNCGRPARGSRRTGRQQGVKCAALCIRAAALILGDWFLLAFSFVSLPL